MSVPMIPLFPGRAISDVRGVRRTFTVTPAAGAEWSLRLPSGSYWRWMLASTNLVTSSNAANRLPGVQIKDADGATIWAAQNSTAVVASKTQRCTYATGVTGVINGATDGFDMFAIPDMFLESNWVISSLTGALDASDQWGTFNVWVEEYDQGPYGARLGTHPQHLVTLTPIEIEA